MPRACPGAFLLVTAKFISYTAAPACDSPYGGLAQSIKRDLAPARRQPRPGTVRLSSLRHNVPPISAEWTKFLSRRSFRAKEF